MQSPTYDAGDRRRHGRVIAALQASRAGKILLIEKRAAGRYDDGRGELPGLFHAWGQQIVRHR
jgi:hypothetical protein